MMAYSIFLEDVDLVMECQMYTKVLYLGNVKLRYCYMFHLSCGVQAYKKETPSAIEFVMAVIDDYSFEYLI